MTTVYTLTGIFSLLFILAYITDKAYLKVLGRVEVLLFLAGLVLRFGLATLDLSYKADINCFMGWSNMLIKDGLSSFYRPDVFTDYPPGYMYILYLVGAIKTAFKLSGSQFEILVKIPAMLFDCATGILIFNIAQEKFSKSLAATLSLAYLLNPAIIVNSAVWGQVDAVNTFVVLLSFYYLTKKRYLGSCLLFAVALLIKPQALFFTPIYLFVVFDYLYDNKFSAKSFKNVAIWGFSSLLLMVAGMLPFTKNLDFSPIIEQYINTITSYPYASLNAYNFYSFMGANWMPVTRRVFGLTITVWGSIFIQLIVYLSLYLLYRFKDKSNYFFTAGLINALTFMFSTRMHERYLFPSLSLFLIAFLYKKERKFLLLYAGFSVTLFINCLDVLVMLKNGNDLAMLNKTLFIVSAANVILTGIMLYTAFAAYLTDKPGANALRKFDQDSVTGGGILNRNDFIIIGVLTVIYAAIAFFSLGDKEAPQTLWRPNPQEEAIVYFGETKSLSQLQLFNGPRQEKIFEVYTSLNGEEWVKVDQEKDFSTGSVFAWHQLDLYVEASYIKIVPRDSQLMLNEVAFRDELNRIIPIKAVNKPEANTLFDEQHLVPAKPTYMNGTYFDEIYHARTAYEFIHKLEVYEWTHPPLGKVIMAAGIKMFGMTPFGWRFMGTFFGVLMLPLLYAFAKRLFNSSFWALFATFIFTFDFMHFAQTRIATIDTYVTIFIIGMYYFMYVYVTTDFYKDGYKKLFIPLTLSGVFMGLAIAAKWPGVYAGGGLALIFFHHLFMQYKRYKKDDRLPFFKIARSTVLYCFVAFVFIPLLIYVLSYIPYLQTPGKAGIKSILDNQSAMLGYHANVTSEHPYSAQWWKWPFDIRPIFYYSGLVSSQAVNGITKDIRSGISSFGNPAVWWVGVVGLFYAVSSISKKYSNILFFLIIGFLAQYLPWVLVTRTTYIYHYFPSVPFIVLLITYLFRDYFYDRRKFAFAFMVIVFVLFVMFYPVLSGMGVDPDYVRRFLRWLPTWQLI